MKGCMFLILKGGAFFATAHLLLIQQYFCEVYDYVERADLSKGHQNPTRKLGVTTHFAEITELLIFPHSHNLCKNKSVLGSTVL